MSGFGPPSDHSVDPCLQRDTAANQSATLQAPHTDHSELLGETGWTPGGYVYVSVFPIAHSRLLRRIQRYSLAAPRGEQIAEGDAAGMAVVRKARARTCLSPGMAPSGAVGVCAGS